MTYQSESVRHLLTSVHLKREVIVDCYLPSKKIRSGYTLLLMNDGQDLSGMKFSDLLSKHGEEHDLLFFAVGIHASENRIEEYGTASTLDFKGRGKFAKNYQKFLTSELIPFLEKEYVQYTFLKKAIAGFSMGGLSAIDTIWNHPETFSICGVFSGSLWWRNLDHLQPEYSDDINRIMHLLIREGKKKEGLKFFFQTGRLDETADRNQNGIIDSIDDTLDLMKELEKKGYATPEDMYYLEMTEGKHDTATWASALPVFLLWMQQQIN